MDPVTFSLFVSPCSHVQCSTSLPYMYAAIRAYATDLLLDLELDITGEITEKDLLFTITRAGWVKLHEGVNRDYKDIILDQSLHPKTYFASSNLNLDIIWDPVICYFKKGVTRAFNGSGITKSSADSQFSC